MLPLLLVAGNQGRIRAGYEGVSSRLSRLVKPEAADIEPSRAGSPKGASPHRHMHDAHFQVASDLGECPGFHMQDAHGDQGARGSARRGSAADRQRTDDQVKAARRQYSSAMSIEQSALHGLKQPGHVEAAIPENTSEINEIDRSGPPAGREGRCRRDTCRVFISKKSKFIPDPAKLFDVVAEGVAQ